MGKFTTIISDLGNVICPFDFTPAYAAIAKRAGVAPEDVKQYCLDTDRVKALETGLMTPDDFLKGLMRRFDFVAPLPQLEFLFSNIFTVNHGVVALWRSLKPRYRFCLLSNTNDMHVNFLKPRYDFWPLFDHLILSYQIGYIKPEPEIFLEALHRCQAEPKECLFVDDIARYVEAAQSLGLTALQFTSESQLRLDLKALGIT